MFIFQILLFHLMQAHTTPPRVWAMQWCVSKSSQEHLEGQLVFIFHQTMEQQQVII